MLIPLVSYLFGNPIILMTLTITAGAFFVARFTGREETCLVTVIIEEMGRGNFSFLILIVGLLQLIVMLRKR